MTACVRAGESSGAERSKPEQISFTSASKRGDSPRGRSRTLHTPAFKADLRRYILLTRRSWHERQPRRPSTLGHFYGVLANLRAAALAAVNHKDERTRSG